MNYGTPRLFLFALACCVVIVPCCVCLAGAVPFADNGVLKMLYDNRMYPQAIELGANVYIVWRGEKGYPYITACDLKSRTFAKPFMLLTGMEDQINARKYQRDHHYSPVIWADSKGYLHTLFGCHGSTGLHLISKSPRDITRWRRCSDVSDSLSYPKVHRIYDDKTLIYFRDQGHLGSWTYRISSDGGITWKGPADSVVDLDAEPQDGLLAAHAGSYHTTRMSKDGRTLHAAFIWKVEEPVLNSRYNRTLPDHTQRYNLYYLKLDLASGKSFNYEGKELPAPVNKSTADSRCLVWDTEERVAAVGPSIYLDDNDQPFFLLPVSDETPHKCRFYFVKRRNAKWVKTAITRTSHPFNACHLARSDDGLFKAYLVTGEGENVSDENMDSYGWGDRVELWLSDRRGENWKLSKDLTPLKGYKYQNVQFMSKSTGETVENTILFYGWQGANSDGTTFLWDDRN